MASDYGLNFGFRRSDESNATREGRNRTPKGSALLQGSAVEIDGANPGYLKQSASNAAATTGLRGLLVQEEDFYGSVFQAAPLLGHDSYDLGVAKADKLSTMWGGPSKVWFRNTAASTAPDGRALEGRTVVDLTGVAVGDALGWDGAKFVKVDGTTITNGWMTVTALSGTDYCEAVLTF